VVNSAVRRSGRNKIRMTAFDRGIHIVNLAFVILVLIIVGYPLLFIISASISDPILVANGKMLLFPKGITFEGYQMVFGAAEIWRGFLNSVLYTTVGTAINVVMTIMAAYPLSRRDLIGRKTLSVLFVFTLYFSGGMIPIFLVVRMLGLYNTMWSLILPGAVSAYNIIVMRSFFTASIPPELYDAGRIDGCTDYSYLLRILLPLSKPVIAVMVLFYGVAHWNSFFSAIIYLRNSDLYPLQVILRNIMLKNVLTENMIVDFGGAATYSHTSEIIKYALIIVSSIPMMVVYPFLQKYFVKGVMIGSLKG
jgi:putative aldouronate transport system permease protein